MLALDVAAHVRGVLAGVAAGQALPATQHTTHAGLHSRPHYTHTHVPGTYVRRRGSNKDDIFLFSGGFNEIFVIYRTGD